MGWKPDFDFLAFPMPPPPLSSTVGFSLHVVRMTQRHQNQGNEDGHSIEDLKDSLSAGPHTFYVTI